MLEKSPPFFRQKQEKSHQNQQNQPSNTGPNFVLQNEIVPVKYFYYDKFAKFFQKIALLISLVFLALLFVNIYLTLRLESERLMLVPLADQVDDYTSTRVTAADVAKKIQFYQQTLTDRVTLGNKSKVIFSNIGTDIKLESALLTPQSFSMIIEVSNPFEIANLISKYMESESVGQIVLRSADLTPSTKKYRVVIDGVFK